MTRPDRRQAAVVGAALAALAVVPEIGRQTLGVVVLGALVGAVGLAWRTPRRAAVLAVAGPPAALVWLQVVAFPVPGEVLILGAILGALSALVAVGMALVYRANRILNFAQADLGAVPTVLAVLLITVSPQMTYLLGLVVGLVAAVAVGAIVELVIIRRFFRSSRLILTVATIGLSQLLTVAAALLPRAMPWHVTLLSEDVDVPWGPTWTVGQIRFTGDHLLPLVVAPLALAALAAFFRYTDVGVAVRAAAERGDRARGLGVPVKRLQTLVWVMAAVLSFVGLFMRAGILGLPAISTLSFSALLTALAALTLGRLTNLPAVAASAVALGILEQAVIWNNSSAPTMVYPVIGGVVVVGLLLTRPARSRSEQDEVASWQSAVEVRPVPAEMRRLPEVVLARWGGLVAGVAVLAALPLWLSPSDEARAALVAVFVIVAVSIVVLTGWAGQVSLGQMSFAAVGAVVCAHATIEWQWDLMLSLPAAGVAGAVTAVLVGLPALRIRGLFLAVTTLAFAVVCSNWLLNRSRFDWIPSDDFDRATLFGRFDLSSQQAMYHVCLGVAVLVLVAVHGIRRSRIGRVLRAQRDNDRGAQSFGVGTTRAKLTGFAVSGFLAASAGALYVQIVGRYTELPYAPAESFAVFTATVVGGLGTLTGAAIGAVYLQGGTWFLEGNWQLLPSAIGVLVVLLVVPGGLGDLVFRVRDTALRRIAVRRGLVVPSLLADVAAPPATGLTAEQIEELAATTAGSAPGTGPEL